MPRVLLTCSALLLLGIITWTTALASYQPAREAAEIRTQAAVQLALNPQPEPPNIPQKSDGTSGKKPAPKAMKAPAKKGDPGK